MSDFKTRLMAAAREAWARIKPTVPDTSQEPANPRSYPTIERMLDKDSNDVKIERALGSNPVTRAYRDGVIGMANYGANKAEVVTRAAKNLADKTRKVDTIELEEDE